MSDSSVESVGIIVVLHKSSPTFGSLAPGIEAAIFGASQAVLHTTRHVYDLTALVRTQLGERRRNPHVDGWFIGVIFVVV